MAKARCLTTLAASIFAALPILNAAIAQEPAPIQIGLVKTFLSEQPKGVAEIAVDDFKGVVKKTTGLDGTISSKFSAFEVAEKLDGKQLDFAIFHAFEFAWVHKKYPQLQPLLIVTDKFPVEKAYLIVHKNNAAKDVADLRGKKLDLPAGTKEHCRLFVDRCIGKDDKGPAAFFGAIEKSANQKDALDKVASEKADATVIDRSGLEFYKEIRGPVFAKNLRILAESADFPPAVVVYKPGTLPQKTVDQFRDGLLKAHTIPEGRAMMQAWHIQAFEPIPKDFAESLAAVLKAYPAR